MTDLAEKLQIAFRIRWVRWAAAAATVLVVYALAGFWLVPLLVRHQWPQVAQSALARQGSVGEVRFNPFTLRLEANDLQLAEADGAPLFAVGQLAVELQWRSILRRAWSFADIHVTRPGANLIVASDGRFNLAALVDTLQARPHDPNADAKLPRIVIEQFALEQGKVDMRDNRAGYANVFTPIDFTLANFSTLPEQNDAYTLSARSASGGVLRWKGRASFDPVRASGELVLENGSLPELAVYLKPYTRAHIAAGRLSATLPYTFAYDAGRFEAKLVGAQLSLADLALAREGSTDAFAALTRLQVSGIDADLVRADVTLGEVRAEGGKLRARRDAKGELDLANLMVQAAGPAALPSNTRTAVAPPDWKVTARKIAFDKVAIDVVDETAQPPLALGVAAASLQLRAGASQQRGALQVQVSDAALALEGVSLASGGQTPVKLAHLTFSGGQFDLASRRAALDQLRADGGQLQFVRDTKGAINLLALSPAAGASAAKADAGKPWSASVAHVELAHFGADVHDQGSGVKLRIDDFDLKLDGAGTDLKQPVKFDGGLTVREGGKLSARGSIVPSSSEMQADVQVQRLALAPLQPLLSQYVKLKIAGGAVNAQGKVATRGGKAKGPAVRYVGSFEVAGLVLNELDDEPFASWKSVSAAKATAAVGPQMIDIPELRVNGADARLIIENDRSFNAARLLVKAPQADAPAAASAPPTTEDDLNIRIRRVRLQDAKLDFTDLSLRPQFAAKIYELNGAINGLSSAHDARSQVELDGRVDEFGLARIRGELNPFAPKNNTDINFVFRNVDMVSASPYSMRFAGYRIAQGKISLDLQYKIRDSKLEGANQIVIDQLTLGERVESPDAIKLPLELAIAVLKDSDGRIDLGVPVSGDLNDPQFSYGAVIGKAIINVLGKIVTAPFRALGSLLGISGDKLESIDFDAGSAKLLAPEREKIRQVAQILAKRAQLRLSVPGQYSEAADGAALRARAVRMEVARRAGIKLEADEEPGPLDPGDRAVRKALRELYAERFGDTQLDKAKKDAENAAPAVPASEAASAPDKLPMWQRVSKMVQGEPQVADARAFYSQLQQRLDREQKLPADALTQLGAQRAQAVVAALKEAGVDAQRAATSAPAAIDSAAGKPVPLKLELAAR